MSTCPLCGLTLTARQWLTGFLSRLCSSNWEDYAPTVVTMSERLRIGLCWDMNRHAGGGKVSRCERVSFLIRCSRKKNTVMVVICDLTKYYLFMTDQLVVVMTPL